ncbi:MAG: beta-propeller domain-containing protein [Syntrophomonas sp.]|nr:beta-propeller domain-containing protein [Syntrophomonas sp.]
MKSPWGKFQALLPVVLLLVFLLTAGGVTIGLATPDTPLSKPRPDLPVIGTYDNLLKLLEKSAGQAQMYPFGGTIKMSNSALGVERQEASKAEAAPSADLGYSNTNVQVQGVDEADLVKTDGTYIYQVNKERVLIIEAVPADQMKVVATIQFEDSGFNPVDLYLDAEKLIVVGTYSRDIPILQSDSRANSKIYSPGRFFQSTRALIYSIKDKSQPIKERELELEGSYLSSRKVDSSFYLLTNKYLDYYNIQNREGITPLWRDTVQGNGLLAEKLEEIHYFPDCISPNYLTIAALDLGRPEAPADIHSYLGSGNQVYASSQSLYVAVNQYTYTDPALPSTSIAYRPADTSTKIHKFALEPGKVQYYGAGVVPGTILNQFSMDENGDYFRIATTSGEMWRSDQYTSQNNVYILDKDLQICGKVENIAPGERIYSTRFMGDRVYMVTFKKVDPFFVLDIKDPKNPKILGKLKIPGYSDYLHPYDENHIIGFGKDTVETNGWNGQSQAFYQGMKIAIFDVTDVSKPVEMSRALIGDRGTDSELLRNHKALLFSQEKNLLAFPVTVMEVQNKTASGESKYIPDYGSFTFQGAYIYRIDLTNGLQFRGSISHISSEDYAKAGDAWFDSDKNVERVLYIGDTLYTLSPDMIKAHDLSGLWEIKTLSLR